MFFEVVIFLIVGFYLLQWIVRLWLRRKVAKIRREMGEQGAAWGDNRTTDQRMREGEVRVEPRKAPRRKVNERIGDYVEYEEVTIIEESE
ncbi:MAG: DUF4834 family protein [Rikenellaceae bacterium]|jgi:hypothetical protein|nr:DUF4834 family protein [Rikenellaceae bacterium]